MRPKTVFFLLFLSVLIGTGLRVAATLYGSFAFTSDVGRDLLAAREIVVQKKMTLLGPTSAIQGLFYTSWWYYFLVLPFVLFSGDPWGVLLFIALLGSLMIPFSFVLGKMVRDQRLGLILASLIAVSPYLIGTSTQIWSPNLVPLFCLLALFFYLLLFQGGSWPPFFFGFFLGLILEHELGFGMFFILAAMLALIYQRTEIKDFRKAFFLVLLGIFLIEVPRFLFELRHEFLMTKAVLFFLKSGEGEGVIFSFERLRRFVLFREIWDASVAGGRELGGLFLAFLSLFSMRSLFSFSKEFNHLVVLTLFIIFIFLFGVFFYPGAVWAHYLVGLSLIFVLFISLVLAWLVQTRGRKMWALVLFVFLVNLNPLRALKAFDPPDWEGDVAVFRNQIAAVDFVYQKAGGEKFDFGAFTPSLVDYTWQYLFWWYGQKKYGYRPERSSQKLFFLILEPDYQLPARREAWLEQRRGDGKIIGRKLVKGKIEVEIRKR